MQKKNENGKLPKHRPTQRRKEFLEEDVIKGDVPIARGEVLVVITYAEWKQRVLRVQAQRKEEV